ncbi:MAG: GNAT family N-acetyltransferase [Desulfitobacterium hafniense]|nr:GNAT family N-acetyltransferase [Desulfitobacterium hafniense]
MDSTKTSDLLSRISIGMEPSRTPLDLEDPSDYVNYLDGLIYYSPEDDDANEREEIIGAFRMVHIDANSATENGTSLFDVYDCDAETFEFFESFVNLDDEEFTNELIDFLESEFVFSGNNVLIIDRIGIRPEYRGNNLGLIVLRNLIQRFSKGVSVVAIKPAPFTFASSHIKQNYIDWQRSETKKDSIEAIKLGKYYQKLGFNKINKSAYLVLGTAKKLPIIPQAVY